MDRLSSSRWIRRRFPLDQCYAYKQVNEVDTVVRAEPAPDLLFVLIPFGAARYVRVELGSTSNDNAAAFTPPDPDSGPTNRPIRSFL